MWRMPSPRLAHHRPMAPGFEVFIGCTIQYLPGPGTSEADPKSGLRASKSGLRGREGKERGGGVSGGGGGRMK